MRKGKEEKKRSRLMAGGIDDKARESEQEAACSRLVCNCCDGRLAPAVGRRSTGTSTLHSFCVVIRVPFDQTQTVRC